MNYVGKTKTIMKKMLKDKIVYLVENENGDLYFTLQKPDFIHETLHKQITLEAYVKQTSCRNDTSILQEVINSLSTK